MTIRRLTEDQYVRDAREEWGDDDLGDEKGERHGSLTVKQILHALFKRKWLIIAFFAACVSLAKVVDVITPPTYRAVSQVMVSPGREHVADFSLPTAGAVPPAVRFNADEETARTVELLTGRHLAEQVVRTIGADVLYPDVRPPWAGPLERAGLAQPPDPALREEGAIEAFLDQVSAEPIGRSSIIELGFRHQAPDLAAQVVNLLGEFYIERYLGMHQDPKTAKFFDEQFKSLKQKLRESGERLLAFKQKHGINSSVSEEQASIRQMQAALRAELTETRSRLAELHSKNAELRGQMVEHGTLYGNLQADLMRNGAEVKALGAREAAITGKIGELQVRLDGLERLRDEHGHLEKQLKADEDSYRLYLTKFEELRIADAMDRERIVSVRVIEPARPPVRPAPSRRDKIMLIGTAVGLLGGIGLALLLQLVRGTLDTPEDVERVLGLSVLASLPLARGR